MATKIITPQLGESGVEGTVARWASREGKTIEKMESILEVSTDKVDTEIPSPAAGTLLKILVPEGTTVNAGVLLAVIGKPGESLDNTTAVAPGRAQAAQEVTQVMPAANEAAVATQPVPAPSAGRNQDLGFIS